MPKRRTSKFGTLTIHSTQMKPYLAKLRRAWQSGNAREHAEATGLLLGQFALAPQEFLRAHLHTVEQYVRRNGVAGIDGPFLSFVAASEEFAPKVCKRAMRTWQLENEKQRKKPTRPRREFRIYAVGVSRKRPVLAITRESKRRSLFGKRVAKTLDALLEGHAPKRSTGIGAGEGVLGGHAPGHGGVFGGGLGRKKRGLGNWASGGLEGFVLDEMGGGHRISRSRRKSAKVTESFCISAFTAVGALVAGRLGFGAGRGAAVGGVVGGLVCGVIYDPPSGGSGMRPVVGEGRGAVPGQAGIPGGQGGAAPHGGDNGPPEGQDGGTGDTGGGGNGSESGGICNPEDKTRSRPFDGGPSRPKGGGRLPQSAFVRINTIAKHSKLTYPMESKSFANGTFLRVNNFPGQRTDKPVRDHHADAMMGPRKTMQRRDPVRNRRVRRARLRRHGR